MTLTYSELETAFGRSFVPCLAKKVFEEDRYESDKDVIFDNDDEQTPEGMTVLREARINDLVFGCLFFAVKDSVVKNCPKTKKRDDEKLYYNPEGNVSFENLEEITEVVTTNKRLSEIYDTVYGEGGFKKTIDKLLDGGVYQTHYFKDIPEGVKEKRELLISTLDTVSGVVKGHCLDVLYECIEQAKEDE